MTGNKFTTMMLRKENLCEQAAVEHENDGYDALASAARDEAADWRAMRKAWVAMVEAGVAVQQEAVCHGASFYVVPKYAINSLDAALTKARAQ